MDDIKRQVLFHLVMLWRRRWLVLGIAWPICVIGWIAVVLLPSKYMATARVYVDTETLLSPLLKGMAVDVDMNQQVEVMQRTLLSRPNLQRVLRMTDLDLTVKSAQQQDQLLSQLAADTAIRSQGTHNLFTVENVNSNPALARSIVQALLNIFVESNLGSSRRDMDQARRFLDNHIGNYEKQLEQAEQRLADFKRKNPDFTQESTSVAQRLDAASQRLAEIKAQLEDATTRRASLQTKLGQVPQFLEVDAAPQVVIENGSARLPTELETRIAQVQRSLDDMLLRYTEQHPDVIATKRMLADLREQAKSAANGQPGEASSGHGVGAARAPGKQKTSNQVYEQVQLKLVEVDADIQTLERRFAEQQAEVNRLAELSKRAPAVEAALASLNRDYGVLRKNYEELLARREFAKLSGSADTNSEKVEFRIIDPPETPVIPTSPNRPLLLSAVLVAGIGAGLAAAFLLGRMQDCFGTIQSLRDAFTLPVLGGVSISTTLARIERRLIQRAAFAITCLGLFLAYGGALVLYVYRDPVLHLLGPVIQPLRQII